MDFAIIKETVSLLQVTLGKQLIVTKGTTAETYFTKVHPKVKLEKYESKPQ